MQAPFRSVRRAAAGVILAASALTILSCAESSTSPSGLRRDAASSNQSLLGSVLGGLHLLQCSPLPYDSVTVSLNGSGGTINVGPHTFVVPPNALSGQTTITAVAPNTNRREVRFYPEGLQFKKPASLTLDYSGCSLASKLLPKTVVYMDDDLDLLELIPSIDNLLSSKVTGKIEHFSSYAVWQ